MGKDKADKNPSKRLRENGSQTDEDDEHVGVGGVMSARLEEMNTKQDQVLTACGEIALLKDEKTQAERNFCSSKRKQWRPIDFLFEDIGGLDAETSSWKPIQDVSL